ncbi:MAG TPA: potassium transporter TrkG, partial [Sphaerochaeta sp.]|nr:potassium transporter TrkG [Sphaerochaeta sp.]
SRSAPSFFTSLRQGAFHTASVLTTAGFDTTDYQGWPPFSQLILFLLFFVGGCGGSAGGGIKVIRIVALVKLVQVQIKRRIHPRGVFQVHIGRSTFGDELLLGIASFFGVYLLTGLIGSAVISLSGVDMLTSTSASFLSLGNIGFGFGALGPGGSFAIFPPWVLWFCSFLMLVGRLELFTVYVLFTKHFWKR